MKIAVCLKKIPDPEIPPAKFRLDERAMKVLPPEGIPPVINPYDGHAVELALRFKEKHDSFITVITIDNDPASSVVRHALAMGADEGIVLADSAFEDSDSFAKAFILSRAIQKIDGCHLILCGRQAADWDEGLVGPLLAEEMGFSLVSLAFFLELAEGQLHVRRVTMDGYQVFSASLPALITVSNEVGQPRLPSGWGIIAASQKKIITWNAEDIGIDASLTGKEAARRKLVKLSVPKKERTCRIFEGEIPEEVSARMAEKLIMDGIIRERSIRKK